MASSFVLQQLVNRIQNQLCHCGSHLAFALSEQTLTSAAEVTLRTKCDLSFNIVSCQV